MKSNNRIRKFTFILKWVVIFVILKVLVGIVSNYPDYFPANFNSDFLYGREGHFYRGYCIAFYTHIVSTPLALITGLFLMNDMFRRRFPAQHRWLGRLQVIVILSLVVPSSLWMSAYALSGRIAGTGFAFLSLTTGFFVMMGWRSAVKRDIKSHRYWMTRCFVLLCSAVVLRVLSGVATVVTPDAIWPYPFSAWVAWLVPWLSLEGYEHYNSSRRTSASNLANRLNKKRD